MLFFRFHYIGFKNIDLLDAFSKTSFGIAVIGIGVAFMFSGMTFKRD